jgi:hypothetical protein
MRDKSCEHAGVLRARTVCLVTLIATFALGCASRPPGAVSVRRVFLSGGLAEGGLSYSEVAWGKPTNRFDDRQDRGYLYIVLNDAESHKAQFTIRRADTGDAVFTTSSLDLGWTIPPMAWLSHAVPFPIAGRLDPGDYVLDLTIDQRATGKYPFTVVSGSPPRFTATDD